jgi:hypothetical protein
MQTFQAEAHPKYARNIAEKNIEMTVKGTLAKEKELPIPHVAYA